jgi:hypothetical protein
MDALTQSIAVAEKQGRFLAESEVSHLLEIMREPQTRLNIAQLLANYSNQIVQLSIEKILGKIDLSDQIVNVYLQDGSVILRYLSYSVLSSSASILEEHYLDGFIEKYIALGVSIDQLRNAIVTMREVVVNLLNHHIPQANEKTAQGDHPTLMAEVTDYFELIIDEFTWESKFAATTNEQWDHILARVDEEIANGETTAIEEVFPPH